MNAIGELVRALTEELKPKGETEQLRLRQATVQALTAPTMTIRIGGSTTNIPGVAALASYTGRANGDTVWVLQVGPDLLVLGKQG